ncbi:MAG: amidohydrolase family protein [Armatimonadota bacterium]
MSLADTFRHAEGMVRLKAKWVLPVDLPPIEDGEVHIEDGEIAWVGKASGREPTADFRMAAILPGLVNCRAQLEHTVLRGLLEDIDSAARAHAMAMLKAQLSLDDWVTSATLGAGEMLSGGITTVADSADSAASLTALLTSGQRGIVFREVSGRERDLNTDTTISVLRKRIGEMQDQIERHHAEERIDIGISPHSPYAVSGTLFRELAAFAAKRGLRQTIRIAESPAEEALIRRGDGPFAETFRQRAIPWSVPGVSPVRYVSDCGAFNAPTLAAHCVQVDDTDVELLKEQNVSVAHCPRSNGKQGVGTAPISLLLKAGVPVGLGTDSTDACGSADLFEEMRFAVYGSRARTLSSTSLTARDALRMATLGGATALGLDKQVGSLRHGKQADLCVVRLDGLHMTPTADDNPEAALVYSARASDVLLTMVNGRVLYEVGTYPRLDMGRLRAAVAHTRQRLTREAAKALASITKSAAA